MKPFMTAAAYLLATTVFSALTGIGIWVSLVGMIGLAGILTYSATCIAYGIISTGFCGYLCMHFYEKAKALTSRKKPEVLTMTQEVNLVLRKAA